jgi:hypothetical protein
MIYKLDDRIILLQILRLFRHLIKLISEVQK